jgi:hypothetical protein
LVKEISLVIIPLTKKENRTMITITERDMQAADWRLQAQPLGNLADFLLSFLAVLWKEWPKEMRITFFSGPEEGKFSLSGRCPHCPDKAAFLPVTTSWHDEKPLADRWIAALRCVSCGGFILGIIGFVKREEGKANLEYLEHYPLGKPDDSVDETVPLEVRTEFQEAIRCRWIEAYKATVLMCRRSLQVSCDMRKAEGHDLFSQIDDLAAKGDITAPLKNMAHRIRLLGKKGAHGDYSDIDDTIEKKDADDAIKFMRHYLEHVYVLRAETESDAP